MADCDQKAVLIVTATLEGTATNVARKRVALHCKLALGHPGAHRDDEQAEEWSAPPGDVPMILRHEDDD